MRRSPTPRWETGTIELFLLTPDGVNDDYVAWLSDPRVNRYLESRFDDHNLASTRAFVAEMLSSDRHLFLGIRSRELRRHVGNIKLGPINGRYRTADIGLMIGDSGVWGRGYATQAIGAIADIAREELGLRKVTAGCYASNVGSERAFLKNGFAIEGRQSAQVLCDDQPEDIVLMGRVFP